jgi:hypothetical protein
MELCFNTAAEMTTMKPQVSKNFPLSDRHVLHSISNYTVYISLSQSFYPGGTLEIIFRSQGTTA